MIARGSIWWAELGRAVGSAPAHRRPVLVVQADAFNRSGLATCVIIAITSNTALAAHPGNVFVAANAAGLDSDSVVNVSQISTIGLGALDDRAGELPGYLLDEVERGMRLVLAL
ncbi:type II toxin-antitoxin system PemK/MazF family toxin [Herbiconiux sp. P18]|uniref:type II toxin-antitoxin system PemK/MazF family toxin n=1 Tax=Herbiconiux liangxiaofengii TaxID=3342795 RepID=UPI0035B9718E